MPLMKILNESGIDLSLTEEYINELIKDDLDFFETTKHYMKPSERQIRERKIRHGRVLLSVIRESLR